MRAATLDLDQLVLREADGAELARLVVGLVCVRAAASGSAGGPDDLRPARIPEPWRRALAELVPGGGAA
jgi:hypothetical protein